MRHLVFALDPVELQSQNACCYVNIRIPFIFVETHPVKATWRTMRLLISTSTDDSSTETWVSFLAT